MARATVGLMAGALLLTGATACAEWSAPPIDRWADAISPEGSDTERPPHGQWAVQDGAARVRVGESIGYIDRDGRHIWRPAN